MFVSIGFGIEIEISEHGYGLHASADNVRRPVSLQRAQKMLNARRDEAEQQISHHSATHESRSLLERFDRSFGDLEFLQLLAEYDIDMYRQLRLIRLYFLRSEAIHGVLNATAPYKPLLQSPVLRLSN